MRYQRATTAWVAGALAVLVAACGGGSGGGGATAGGGDGTPPPAASLQLSGTAAIGAALSNAAVEAKCATGTGATVTADNGTYTLTLQGASLPCILRVRSKALSLHSIVEAGSTNAATAVTSASANLTPVSELLVAQLTANMPSIAYDFFGPAFAGLLTPERVNAAVISVSAALKANGVDLGTIDPLKGALVAANGTAQGNAHDKVLDRLATQLSISALPQVVNQVALAATVNSASGLATAIAAVSGGSLPGCPTALSGNYRTLDHGGKAATRKVDFKTMKWQAANGTDWFDITSDPGEPCVFKVAGVSEGKSSQTVVAMGVSGVGIYRSRFVDPDTPGTVGYMFPAQAHSLAIVTGTWSFLQSGFSPGHGTDHAVGQYTVSAADGKVDICRYDTQHGWACTASARGTLSMRSDGGFDLVGADAAAVLHAYRAPSGTLTLFGSTNPVGANSLDVSQTSIVAAKLQTLALPGVNEVSQYREVAFTQMNGANNSFGPGSDSSTVTSVDAAAGKVTRRSALNGRIDTLHFNQPLPGWLTRDGGGLSGAVVAGSYQLPLPGLGAAVAINSEPVATTGVIDFGLRVLRP